MNQYLLLRDNKQSGPYSAEELAAKGLKAYDLVWLEGKSAAWRYPSEISELKPFAPVVEEQPYDRFYKKTAEEAHPYLDQARQATLNESRKEAVNTITQTHIEELPPVQESAAVEPYTVHITPETQNHAATKSAQDVRREPEIIPVHPKKIYVTLPASNGHSSGNGQQKQVKKVAASFSQTISTVKEEQPVKEAAPLPDLYTQLQENERSRPTRKRSFRPVMAVLVAACFLLFGVIIGLYISNLKQQNQNRTLESQMKQILERDRTRNSIQVSQEEQPEQETQQTAVDSSNVLNNDTKEPEKKLPISTVAKKGKASTDNKRQAVNTIPASIPQTEPIAANTGPEETEEKTTYQQAAIESARKNIHQMLLVENSKFRTGVLGGISNLHMTVSNNSRFPLDQVEIEIKYLGPEQKLVKTQTLLFNDLAPGEQKTLEAPNTRRGISIDYAITRINSKVLGLAQHKQF